MKYDDLQNLSPEQLEERVRELREEQFNLRFQAATRQLTNTSRLRQVRRDVARVLTRQRELELQVVEV